MLLQMALFHSILLVSNINELIYKREIDSDIENKFTVPKGDSRGRAER